MERQDAVNKLVLEAIRFLAEKNGTSEKHIAVMIASCNEVVIKQIDELVKAALADMWGRFQTTDENKTGGK